MKVSQHRNRQTGALEGKIEFYREHGMHRSLPLNYAFVAQSRAVHFDGLREVSWREAYTGFTVLGVAGLVWSLMLFFGDQGHAGTVAFASMFPLFVALVWYLNDRYTIVMGGFERAGVLNYATHLADMLEYGSETEQDKAQVGAEKLLDLLNQREFDVLARFTDGWSLVNGDRSVPVQLSRVQQALAVPKGSGRTAPVAEETVFVRAASRLGKSERSDDASVVRLVAQRVDQLHPDQQVVAESAAQTVVDAYDTLDRLPVRVASTPGPDGTSPSEDAEHAVDLALEVLRSVSDESYRADTDALRSLRRYAQQWAPRGADPLHLDDGAP